MSEQQYRVIADRLENNPELWIGGDDNPHLWPDVEDAVHALRSIERPVPTSDSQKLAETEDRAPGFSTSPHPPTREQIAEALYDHERQPGAWRDVKDWATRDYHLEQAEAVLALVQNGADRG